MRETTLNCDQRPAFKRQLVGAHERRHTDFIDQIIAMSVRGMTAPEMQRFLAETHALDVPVTQITKLSDVLSAQVSSGQSKPLQATRPIAVGAGLSPCFFGNAWPACGVGMLSSYKKTITRCAIHLRHQDLHLSRKKLGNCTEIQLFRPLLSGNPFVARRSQGKGSD